MSEVFYCPDCADYSSDRFQELGEDGFPTHPLCKHCGCECDDLANEPRMETIANMVKEMGEAREAYKSLIDKVQDLTNEVRHDYQIEGELIHE
jgi:hypothetical protein